MLSGLVTEAAAKRARVVRIAPRPGRRDRQGRATPVRHDMLGKKQLKISSPLQRSPARPP